MRWWILSCNLLLATATGCRSVSEKDSTTIVVQTPPYEVTRGAAIGAPAERGDVSFEEKLLLTLPEGVPLVDAVISADGRSATYRVSPASNALDPKGDRNTGTYRPISRPE